MKKALSLVLALALLLCAVAAVAEPTAIDGKADRGITINTAGLNEAEPGVSPTTGRKLDEIACPDGFLGMAVTGVYQPFMVQISNSNNGVGTYSGTGSKSGQPYRLAPVNGTYADVVYEAVQKRGGSESRMSMIFSDTIPDYVGFVRSTRATHPRIRQEWECAFCTSGYSVKDVPEEWKKLGVKNPAGATDDDPGIAYVGDFPKVWHPYVFRLHPYQGPNNEIFNLTGILQNVVPKDHVPANHTWLFTDEKPTNGDSGEIIYVTFGDKNNSDSRLEYDAANNCYIRYVAYGDQGDLPYCENKLVNPRPEKVKDENGNTVTKLAVDDLAAGEPLTFNNVIVQGIEMKWEGQLRPDPQLVGTGIADYFMGGKHIAGVWQREDMNSRTVFYGEDGNEIKLQRGKTLIILMGYNDEGCGVKYE